jgi:hypothetical protein
MAFLKGHFTDGWFLNFFLFQSKDYKKAPKGLRQIAKNSEKSIMKLMKSISIKSQDMLRIKTSTIKHYFENSNLYQFLFSSRTKVTEKILFLFRQVPRIYELFALRDFMIFIDVFCRYFLFISELEFAVFHV